MLDYMDCIFTYLYGYPTDYIDSLGSSNTLAIFEVFAELFPLGFIPAAHGLHCSEKHSHPQRSRTIFHSTIECDGAYNWRIGSNAQGLHVIESSSSMVALIGR